MALADMLAFDLAVAALVFCRIGTAIMLLPGFGDAYVSPRIRLMIALAVTLAILPVVGVTLTAPQGLGPFVLAILGEIGVGAFLGTCARILFSALQTAGTIVAMQTSLANAFVQEASSAQQAALIANFYGLLGLVIMFTTDMHHLVLAGLVDSYRVFPPFALPPMGDVAHTAARLVSGSMRLALMLAAPVVMASVVVMFGMGMVARLMPQVQVFFLAVPAQIAAGLLLLALTLSSVAAWFMGAFEDGYVRIFTGG